MSEEPSALVLNFENTAKLVSANTLLAGHDQVNGLQHLGEGKARMFEHGAKPGRELLAPLATRLEAVANLALGALLARLRQALKLIASGATALLFWDWLTKKDQ